MVLYSPLPPTHRQRSFYQLELQIMDGNDGYVRRVVDRSIGLFIDPLGEAPALGPGSVTVIVEPAISLTHLTIMCSRHLLFFLTANLHFATDPTLYKPLSPICM